MGKKKDAESVKIDSGLLSVIRRYKKLTGLPFGRFIEDAIAEKLDRFPDDIKGKIGVKTNKQ